MNECQTAPTALIDGPHFPGEWGAAAADAFQMLGFRACVLYDDTKKQPLARWVKRLNKAFPVCRRWWNWELFWLRRLLSEVSQQRPLVFLSIQGKLDPTSCRAFKQLCPGLRILYWVGDIIKVHPSLVTRVQDLRFAAREGDLDLFLVSTKGNEAHLRCLGIDRVKYFPFGYSPKVHGLNRRGPRPTSHKWRVSFVATPTNDRAQFIRELNTRLPFTVALFGRGWEKYGFRCLVNETVAEGMRVHRDSQIALNLMRPETDGSMNMRFYEIPAAGGFQICSFQPEILESPLRETPTFRDVDECAKLITYYLEHEQEREALRKRLSEIVRRECSYARLFRQVLADLGMNCTEVGGTTIVKSPPKAQHLHTT